MFDIDAGTTPNIQANGVLAAALSGVDASKYRTSLLETYQTDGKQYALPTSFSDVVLFYNKDLFDAAGVAYPTADWTWADEKAAAKKLTDKAAGVWGDYQPVSYNEFYKVLAQTGGSFLNDDGTKSAFNSDAGERGANWLAGKSGTVMPTAAARRGNARLRHEPVQGRQARDVAHRHLDVRPRSATLPFSWDIVVEPGDTQKASAVVLERGRRVEQLEAARRPRRSGPST